MSVIITCTGLQIVSESRVVHRMEASQSDQSMVGEMVSGSLEHSTTMCHPEEANTEHKERNVFLAEHSRTSRNEDCVSDDCEDVVSGEAFSSPLNYQDPVSGGGEASPGHLEDDNILEEEILTPSKTNLTFVALTPSPSGSRDRLQATSPSQRVIQVRKKSDLSLDERQEEGRRLSHRTPPSGAKIERSVVVDSPLLFLPVDLDILSLRDWDTDSMEGRKAALVETNNTGLAVFRYGSSLVATQATCPHAGGQILAIFIATYRGMAISSIFWHVAIMLYI